MPETPMTKAERLDLAKLARMRERVARSEVDQRAAELRADVEQQLSATYTFTDEAWADVTSAADAAVKHADAEIAGICRARGIPEEFRPSLAVQWYRRGENAVAGRRAELRKTAQSQIDAKAQQAKHEIAAASVEVQTKLPAAGISTEAAQAFLSSMPTPRELMPTLDMQAIDSRRGSR